MNIPGPDLTARQGSAGPWDCICGYPGSSSRDLEEHLIGASPGEPEGAHRPASRR